MPHAVINLENCSYCYEPDVFAVRGASLSVEPGEFIAVVGANGSGKSTLARIMAGLVQPTDGAAQVPARGRVGVVFQDPESQSVASLVEDDVAFGPENLGLEPVEIRSRVDKALAAVDATDLAQREVAALSGGQQQRVCIAGALAMQPEALVLDEPTSMLDAPGRAGVMAALKRAQEAGVAVVMVTHHMPEARQAQRVVVLKEGSIVLQGAPEQVFSCADVLADAGLIANEAPQQPVHTAGGDPIITLQDVGYAYPDATQALQDIDLQIHSGICLGIVGNTGSGKSTLLQLLDALLVPSQGVVVACGFDTRPRKNHLKVRQKVGLVFQRPELQLFASTVLEDVMFGPLNIGCDAHEARERAMLALEQVGLDAKQVGQRSPFHLSGGQQRLAALAGVLAMEPQVLCLDEPMAGLDTLGRCRVRKLVCGLVEQGTTVVLVSHETEDIATLCNAVIGLEAGKISNNPIDKQA